MALRRQRLIISVVALIVLIGLGYFVWRTSSEKPECNCVFTQTRDYGVIKGDECVVVACKPKQK